jgi:hypothetical protein
MNISSGAVGAIASDQVLTESNESNVDADEEQATHQPSRYIRADDVPGASAVEVPIAQTEKVQNHGQLQASALSRTMGYLHVRQLGFTPTCNPPKSRKHGCEG